jgi:hypothetical protein
VELPPGGVTVNDRRYWIFQLAVANLAPFIITVFEGEVVPVASPVQLVKTYCIPSIPGAVNGDTVAEIDAPESYQPPPPAVP